MREEELRELLGTEDRWAIRGLLRLYEEQTPAEQFVGRDVGVRNGRGFSPIDAAFLSAAAEDLLDRGRISRSKLDAVKRRVPTYARQLLRICATERLEGANRRYREAATPKERRALEKEMDGLLRELAELRKPRRKAG